MDRQTAAPGRHVSSRDPRYRQNPFLARSSGMAAIGRLVGRARERVRSAKSGDCCGYSIFPKDHARPAVDPVNLITAPFAESAPRRRRLAAYDRAITRTEREAGARRLYFIIAIMECAAHINALCRKKNLITTKTNLSACKCHNYGAR